MVIIVVVVVIDWNVAVDRWNVVGGVIVIVVIFCIFKGTVEQRNNITPSQYNYRMMLYLPNTWSLKSKC